MPTYTFTKWQTITTKHKVKASSMEEATELFLNGEATEIPDTLDSGDVDYEISEVEE